MADVKKNEVVVLTCEGPGAYAFEFGNDAVIKILQHAIPTLVYDVEVICAKDSQDMTDTVRKAILNSITERKQSSFLITHGTDTLCETALYLIKAGVGQGDNHENGRKTVVLTGAFKPEAMKDSDADFNVGFAFGILQCAPPGVFIAMEGALLDGAHATHDEKGKFKDERLLNK